MRKMTAMMMVLVLICSSIFSAANEYDIGGGQTLLLNEDGTYEIITSRVESDRIVGKQYKLDLMRTLDPLISLAMMEEPSSAILGKEYYYSVLEDTGLIDMIASEIPDFSVVFLSMEKVLVTIDGEPFETTYRITPSRDLYVDGWDGVEREFGIFSENYEEIRLTIEDTFPAYLVRQD